MQTRIDHANKTARYHFDSLHEMAAWIDRTPHTWPRERVSQDVQGPPSKSWDLNAGWAGAVEMALNGWNEGAQRVQEALKAFPTATPAPDTKTDFYGFRPHVARFCAGAPDCMIRHTRDAENGGGRVLTLAVGCTANAYTDARHMANFGVAVAQYVNQLEMQGTRVEVIGGVMGSFRSGWRVSHTFTVKGADQPLDLAVLAFAIGHPAMLRRIALAAIERCEAPEEPGYGSAADLKLADLINPAPGVVILNGMRNAHENAPTAEAGFAYVSKQIEKAIEARELGE